MSQDMKYNPARFIYSSYKSETRLTLLRVTDEQTKHADGQRPS
jgi:hypothetical protein